MSSVEFSAWLAFDSTCSLPDIFTLAGVIAPLIKAAASGKRATAEEFIPYFRPASSAAGGDPNLEILKRSFPEAFLIPRPDRG